MMKILSGLMFYLMGAAGVFAQPLPLHEKNLNIQDIPLPKRVELLEKRLSNKTFLKMFKQMQELHTEVKQLRGEVEGLNDELQRLKKRQREFYLDLDQRIIGLQGGKQPARFSKYSPLTAPPVLEQEDVAPKTSPVQTKPATSVQKKEYQKAFRTLQSSEYDSAIKLFKRFIEKHPNAELTDNAQYWLAEAHYVRRDFSAAKEAFERIIRNFPDSSKVEDALLKTGFIAYEEQKLSKAESILKDVIVRYPDSTVSRLAKERLARISKRKQ